VVRVSATLGDGLTPHTLRHTWATRLMQRGVSIWEASGYRGMSRETLERVYGHHHPEFLRNASKALN
jgi:integrase